VVGEEGILQELDLKGIKYAGGPADGGKTVSLAPGVFMEHDHDVSELLGAMDVCAINTLRAGLP